MDMLRKIVEDDFWTAVEVGWMKDLKVKMMRGSSSKPHNISQDMPMKVIIIKSPPRESGIR